MRIADEYLGPDGRIDLDRFASAALTGLQVGVCHCGAPAIPAPGTSAFGVVFLEVVCLYNSDHEATIPTTRVVRPPAVVKKITSGVSAAVLQAGRDRDAAILGERD